MLQTLWKGARAKELKLKSVHHIRKPELYIFPSHFYFFRNIILT